MSSAVVTRTSLASVGLSTRLKPCSWLSCSLLALLLLVDSVRAQSLLLGDLDRDGDVTIQDLVHLLKIIDQREDLPKGSEIFADLNSNGVIGEEDVPLLEELILGATPPRPLPRTSIAWSSPDNGEQNVSVRRETVIKFTRPLSPRTTITPSQFYATFSGKRILGRVELASDFSAATLFYQQDLAGTLPGSALIQVTFDGNGVRDQFEAEIDADGDGVAGGAAKISFETVNITTLVNTIVCGRVFASELTRPSNGQTNLSIDRPLSGVVITVDGQEDNIRAFSDNLGNFRITNAPGGEFFVHIDGRTVTNVAQGIHYPDKAYYPIVGKLWSSLPGGETNIGEIYLPLVAASTLKSISITQATTVTFPASVLAQNPDLAGVSLTIPANGLLDENGKRGGKVGIAPVAPDRLPGPLPSGLNLPLVITVQTDGPENFAQAVPVCFPNLPDPTTGVRLSPGAKTALWSFNHDTGIWEIRGSATISEDGKLACSDPGFGILAPGWHGVAPGTSGPDLLAPKDSCVAYLPLGPHRGQPVAPGTIEAPIPEGYELVDNDSTINVHLHSGEYVLSVVDLRIKGRGFDFEWSRKYRSRICSQTEMGVNWDYSYNIRVVPDGQSVKVCNGASREDLYRPREADKWVYNGFFRELTKDPGTGGYILTFEDKKRWEFLPFDNSHAAGKLSKIVDRNQNTMQFQYGSAGRLTNVIDTLGRNIRIEYGAEGFISGVVDFAGRKVGYQHFTTSTALGEPGDLSTVISPAVTGIPTANAFPQGKTNGYTYSVGFTDDRLNHNLLTVRDARGNVVLANTYSTNLADFDHDRVLTQKADKYQIQIVYQALQPSAQNGEAYTRTIVNDRNGHVRSYYYDIQNQLILLREFTGEFGMGRRVTEEPSGAGVFDPDTTLPSYDTRFSFNTDHQIKRIEYPNLNSVEYVYESDLRPDAGARVRGNLRKVIRHPGPKGGDQFQITEEYDYEPQFGSAHYALGPQFVTRYLDGKRTETTYSYDEKGNRKKILHAQGKAEEDFQYNQYGQLIQHTQPKNAGGHRRVDGYVYYESAPSSGYLREEVIDAVPVGGGVGGPGPYKQLTTAYEYDMVGNVTKKTDPRGNSTEFFVNQLDQTVRELSVNVGLGITAHYRKDTFFDANNNIEGVAEANIDANGSTSSQVPEWKTVFKYDNLNRLIEERRLANAGKEVVTQHDYDGVGNQIETRYGEASLRRQPGNRVKRVFNHRNQIRAETKAPGTPDSTTTEFHYDGNRNVISVASGIESGSPHITQSDFDGYNRERKITDAMGNVKTRVFDANGNITNEKTLGELEDIAGSSKNIRLSDVSNVHDELNRLTKRTAEFFDPTTQQPLGTGRSVLATDYADNSQVIRVVDANGNATTNYYDRLNRLVSVADAKGNTTTNTHDDNGNIVSILQTDKSDLGRASQRFLTTNIFDNLNRKVSTTDSAGNTTTVGFDSRNNAVRLTDARGNVTASEFDGLNRLTKTTRFLTENGRGDGASVGTIVTKQEWDDSSRLTSMTDNGGHVTRYEYDPADRLKTTQYADGTARSTDYDPFGNSVSSHDANGTVVKNAYDALNRLTSVDVKAGPGVSSDTTFEKYHYDGLSRITHAEDNDSLLQFGYNSLGNKTKEIITLYPGGVAASPLLTATNRLGYDEMGNLTSITYPSGQIVKQNYDASNQKRDISYTNALIAHYDYVGVGRVERRLLANGIQSEFTYDGLLDFANAPHDFGALRISSIKHTRQSGGNTEILDSWSFNWDGTGNKTTRFNDLSGITNTLSYDSVSRMVRSRKSQGIQLLSSVDYQLDGDGNRLKTVKDGATNSYTLLNKTPEPADAQVNQYTTTPFDERAYDSNGNLSGLTNSSKLKRSAEYNYRNQLVEMEAIRAGDKVGFRYDALGRRFQKAVTTVLTNLTNITVLLFLSFGDQVLEERNGTNGLVASYVHGRLLDETVSMRRGAEAYYFHADDLLNVTALSDANGRIVERYDYADYGAPSFFGANGKTSTESGVSNSRLFNGRRYEAELVLYDYRARFLDPMAGRFVQRDPKGYVDGPNLFAYAGNNPWSRVDPLGMEEGKEPEESQETIISSPRPDRRGAIRRTLEDSFQSFLAGVRGDSQEDAKANFLALFPGALESELANEREFRKSGRAESALIQPLDIVPLAEVASGASKVVSGLVAKRLGGRLSEKGIETAAVSAAKTGASRFSQLRGAATFLRDEAGISSATYRRQVIESFGADMRVGTYQGQAYQYSGFGRSSSRYLTPTPLQNPVQQLALPPSNPAVSIQQYNMSSTRVLMGTVAPQNFGTALPGGAQQIFIPSRSVLNSTLLLH